MFVLRLFLTLFIVIFMHVQGYASVSNTHNHEVDIVTNMGVIRIELFEDKAPISVQNFLVYASDGFYNSTLFHRTIKDFMIQGGGFTTDMIEKRHFPPIQNEAKNGLLNDRGTVAMARTKEIGSMWVPGCCQPTAQSKNATAVCHALSRCEQTGKN